jgi:hypothetical protein
LYGINHELKIWARYVYDYIRWIFRYKNSEYAVNTFSFNSSTYFYFVHPYNHTWENERAIEIPVVYDLVRKVGVGTILEVGNVLSHYYRINHTILDKYEHVIGRKIINQDIADWNPESRFDLIISISTIEHIGWDEKPQNPQKVLIALRNIINSLSPKGKAFITFPAGYNNILDNGLKDGTINYEKCICLRRATKDNQWEEVDLNEALQCSYGEPYKNANAVIFLELTK